MNDQKLSECSSIVRETLLKLEEFYNEHEEYGIGQAPGIYVLSLFDSDQVQKFSDSWDVGLNQDIVSHCILEYPMNVVFLFKVFSENEHLYPDNQESLESVYQHLIASQHRQGLVLNEHERNTWALAIHDADSKATEDAVDYFFQKHEGLGETGIEEGNQIKSSWNVIDGCNALLELNYNVYSDLVGDIMDEFDWNAEMETLLDKSKGGLRLAYPLSTLWLNASHLEKSIPENIEKACKDVLKEDLGSIIDRIEDKGWETAMKKSGRYHPEGLEYVQVGEMAQRSFALITAGEGYTISGYRHRWEKKVNEQRHEEGKPELLSTLPAAKLEDRSRDIERKTEEILESTTDSLKICSLRIDMLEDSLLDLIESGVDVKILTNRKSAEGERRKMARAVMNELSKKSEGNVREDPLVHARFIISDEREALIGSADLTRDQLVDEFNLAIYTKDPNTVGEASTYFNQMYEQAEERGVR